jgi:hypothetical protein
MPTSKVRAQQVDPDGFAGLDRQAEHPTGSVEVTDIRSRQLPGEDYLAAVEHQG